MTPAKTRRVRAELETIKRFLGWTLTNRINSTVFIQEYRKLPKDRAEIVKAVHEALYPERMRIIWIDKLPKQGRRGRK